MTINLPNDSFRWLSPEFIFDPIRLTTAGWVFSILSISYVFGQWDLNFLQIASPADVIMSGLLIGLPPALFAVTFYIGYMAAKYRHRLGLRTSPVVIICLLLIIVTSNISVNFPVAWIVVCQLSGLSGVISAYYSEGFSKRTSAQIPSRRESFLFLSLTVLTFSIFLLQVALEFKEKTSFGFDRNLFVNARFVDGRPCYIEVLWIGEHAIVVRTRAQYVQRGENSIICQNLTSSRLYQLIREPESLSLIRLGTPPYESMSLFGFILRQGQHIIS